MSDFVRRHPALALFLLATSFGGLLVAPVVAGLAPPAFTQLGALSASAAGIILAAIEGGRGAVRELLRRVLIWRVGLGWWAFVLFFPLVPAVTALWLAPQFGLARVDWSTLGPWYELIPPLVILTVFAGLGEEFGWRGFAVPRLRRRHTALITSLIIGGFHAAWHLPLFLVKGERYHGLAQQLGFLPAFLGYAILVLALTVQITWIFINTRGSVLLVAVYHGATNAWNGYLDIERGQLVGVYAYLALMAVISTVIVLIAGPATFARQVNSSRSP